MLTIAWNFSLAYGQTHYTKVWSGNGFDHMNINILSTTIDGENLGVGDEVAVFDGDYCVGVGIVTTPGNEIYIIASKNDPDNDFVDGYRVGNPIIIKIWDAGEQVEITNIEISEFYEKDLIFEIGETLWLSMVATSPCIPPDAPVAGTVTHPTCSVATGSVVLSGLPSGTWTVTKNPGGETYTGTGESYTVTGLAAGTYTFTVTNAAGCISLSSTNVVINTQPPTPAAPVAGTVTHPTWDNATGSVVLTGLPSGTWTINPGNINGSGTSASISGLSSGTYNFTVTNASGCTSPPSADVVINPQPVNAVPTVTNVLISGTAVVGQVLTGTYIYADAENDPEGTSQYRWLRNSNPIAGVTSATYTLTEADGGKEIVFEVTPVAQTGASPGTTVLSEGVEVKMEQVISLLAGWNIFSLCVVPDNVSLTQVMHGLIDEESLEKVQDETGDALEKIPNTSDWINDIGNWNREEGYKINVNKNTIIRVTGVPFTDPVAISLTAGWNIISYPVNFTKDATEVLEDLMDSGNLVKVQDETGAALEIIPGGAEWVNNIGDFIPGKGYKIWVTNNDLLTISPDRGTKAARTTLTDAVCPAGAHYKPAWQGNGLDHMNIYVSGGHEGLLPGDEIGIFDRTVCVASGVIRYSGEEFYSLVASLNDPLTTTKDGFDKGNRLIFKVWRPSENRELLIKNVMFHPGGNDLFEPMGTAMVTLDIELITASEIELQQQTALSDVYPNPARNRTTIPFSIGKETKVEIAIYTSSGKKLVTLANGKYKPGSYSVEWNIPVNKRSREVASGIYFCKMVAQDKEFVKKLIVK